MYNQIRIYLGIQGMDWTYHYYLSNNLWVYSNIILIIPFLYACHRRIRNPDISLPLWSDHITRILLIYTWLYYIYDIPVKIAVDQADTICKRAFLIHHIATLFVLPPIIINQYIPWWVNPIGFLHGFVMAFPDFEPLNYIYAVALIVFHYGIYQAPFKDLKYYWVTRISICGIWVFAIYVLIGTCTNYLPLEPDL